MIQIFVVASFLMFISQNAMAFCSEPSTPWGKPVKPSVPYCVNEWDRTHTCDDWEIDSYNTALESYNYEVQSYIRQLNDYIDEAVEYAQCEVNNLE